jgi:hypothetical protein
LSYHVRSNDILEILGLRFRKPNFCDRGVVRAIGKIDIFIANAMYIFIP